MAAVHPQRDLESQARASALCEAIERYSGESTGSEVVVTASFTQMRERFGPDVIHPNEVMLYSERQLAERKIWNDRKSKFNRVVEPLDESVPIDWTPVWSLTHSRHKYLPTQLLYYRSRASASCDTFFCMGCSNGNASGNNLEEAVLQGFCELVERDAVALWWYNRLRKPAMALESFEEPYLLDLIGHYRSLGREAWTLDITSDLGIPAFAVFGLGLWGAGCFAGSSSLWEYVFIAFSLFNFFGLIMNFNPFIKMDAYYMLMDLTGILNLREKSFRFLNRKLWGWLGFGADEDVKVSIRERRTFWWYGLLGSGMTFLFVAAPLLQLGHLLQTRSLHGGRSLLLIAGCSLFLVRMGTVALNKMRGIFYREYKLK